MTTDDDARNPWLSIPASDYEGHMGDPGVLQLQFLGRVFRGILDRYRPRSLAVLGCATGNGFEHIDPRATPRVIGVDINPEYLAVLRGRFEGRIPGLELECADLAACVLNPRSLDLVHCALVLEYVDPRVAVGKAAEWLAPGGVLSVVLQLASSGRDKVTHAGFESLAALDAVMRLVPPRELDEIAVNAGLSRVESRVESLESGKQFYVAVYRQGCAVEIPILFEDADVVAVSKPEGLASIPERSADRASLLAAVQASTGGKLYVVHRLDKAASGVMLFAKNPESHRCINDQFARREVSKTYLALTHGHIGADRGTVRRPIRSYGSGRMGVDDRRGKQSSTGYEVVRFAGPCTLVKAHPTTGRRHQIRVHFYSLGHPVVGDVLYGDLEVQRRFPRLMLHALSIAFRSPAGEAVTVESPVPESFNTVLGGVAEYF